VPFLRLILTRIATSIVTLWLVSVMVFLAVEVLPGDVASRILGREAPEAAKAALRDELNLDAPVIPRYLAWAGGALTGDFGQSIASGKPVSEVLGQRLGNTLLLSGLAFLIYLPLSILPAMLQAQAPDGPVDRLIGTITMLLLALPEFLTATLFLFAFAVVLPWFPPIAQLIADMTWGETLHALALPAATLGLLLATYGVRLLRESLVGLKEAEFIRMARLKGLTPRRILWVHLLPNAVTPWLNATALNVAFLIGGVVVVEKVFGFPGFGSMLVDALQLRDLPVIEAGVLIAAAIFILVNLLADLLSLLSNPRLRGLS
jgi:peptide/nickel transport system permease protein